MKALLDPVCRKALARIDPIRLRPCSIDLVGRMFYIDPKPQTAMMQHGPGTPPWLPRLCWFCLT